MGWWARNFGVPELDAPVAETRSVSIGDPAVVELVSGYGGLSAPAVGESRAMTLSAVFRAVSLIAGSLGSLPLRTLEQAADGTSVRSASVLDNPGLGQWTPFEWKELIGVYLLLHGAAPLLKVRGGGGQLIGYRPLHPQLVEVSEDPTAEGGRRFKLTLGDGTTREMDANEITYIPGLSLDGVTGISVITAARLGFGTALAGDKASYRTFTNGGMVAGMVTPDGVDFDKDDAQTIKDLINRKVLGPENAGDIPVINKALKFTQWTLSAADQQFLESRSFSIDEIGRWFGVPPHLLGLTEKSTSWGQGIAEQNRGLARYTLTNWTDRIASRLSIDIPAGKVAEFDYAGFIAPSPEDEIGLLIDQVNAGLLTLNEARRVRNLPPLPDPAADLARTPAGAVPPVLPTGPAAPATDPTTTGVPE
jgi:HK97 family phage portal protein